MPGLNGGPNFATQVVAALHGAVLLARGRAEGIAFTALSADGPTRSFFAAVLCLPAYVVLRVIGWDGNAPDDVVRTLFSELVSYVLSWTAFATLSLPLARAFGREASWPRFIAAWNWASVVQYAVLLASGLLPDGSLGTTLGLVAMGYALWIGWFVAGRALQIDGRRASGFVLLDLVLGILVTEAARILSVP